MNTQEKIGKLLEPTAQRDAIHIAVAPVVAAETLEPGTGIGFEEDGRVSSKANWHLGVIA